MQKYWITIAIDANTDQREKAESYANHICEEIVNMRFLSGQKCHFKPVVMSIEKKASQKPTHDWNAHITSANE